MGKTNNLQDFLLDLAIAIREKRQWDKKINPQDFSNSVRRIGLDTNVKPEHILKGKIAYSGNSLVVGTIPTYDYYYSEDGIFKTAAENMLIVDLAFESINTDNNVWVIDEQNNINLEDNILIIEEAE